MRAIIVNADDFGLTRGTSLGIMWAFREGIVTSTSMMVTGSDFAYSVKLAKFARIPVGLHLCLSYGRPVSAASDIRSLVDDNGSFKKIEVLRAEKVNPRHIEKEWRAQLAALKAAGINPDHLDSHHYVHEYLGETVLDITAKIALEMQVPVRCTTDDARRFLTKKGIKTTESFCGGFYGDNLNPASLIKLLSKHKKGCMELMCHPGQNDGLIDMVSSYSQNRAEEMKTLLAPEVRAFISKRGIKLISFADL